MGLKDLIRAADDIRHQDDVEIPEWAPGVMFQVRGLPDEDWEEYQNKLSRLTVKQGRNADAEMAVRTNKAEIVAKALYDQESGELVFPELKEGVAILRKKSAGIVNGLFELVKHLSDDDKDFVEKVKDAEEDFSGGQN
ncbi:MULTISPECIES: hypothetical protein [Protofrankia]|uniref:Uncharacterized protein n=1 Tax=Protofrankia coriariae TaxID=1562887 RepID=A0ABR5F4G6_9ACTN|nr:MULTISPECIES: hypothetical protein [Protofrankia]KLL11577.1 hypothetical protein FrCorBMG51_11115 [Protofrankia coriariae]ONH35712.1 hypothetical protein BL254_10510 [Protofrankia sp. BMG5.30]